ncbi:slipin family protein [Corallococcus macrosporus]|uniref:SPFH domain-containing protein/band 7 family protein n=1 Tax=Myxococcus fulvus (strain ATCC BAA-855 / HW-1) TaxID=483219 RepID=F8C8T3_MYXFH|nr:slipin family protein [Corallococcus macrosporus]AEI63230.1 SPFH domain-containing protein/band 7 family protein [Corallococcus macrosporus]
MSIMRVTVGQNERAFVLVNEKPERYLVPGRYWLTYPFHNVRLVRVSTEQPLAQLDPALLALVPEADLQVVELGADERAILFHKGRPVRWLGRGLHQVWTVERIPSRDHTPPTPTVRVDRVDTSGIATAPLRDDVRALVPASDYVEATATEGTVVLRYVDGVLDAELPPGRHAAWTVARKVQLAVIDLRERLLHVTGQEVMTQDRVTLRLNLSAAFRVADARRLAVVSRAPDDVLYLAMQLAAREAVSERTLDELLASREAVAEGLFTQVKDRANTVGLELLRFGIKDVVLPGEMKELLNRVIQAQKEAEANVILRREETAATRSMAQTAKVLAENPLLVRLKELEAYKDLASKVGQVHLVLGEGAVPTLQLKSH